MTNPATAVDGHRKALEEGLGFAPGAIVQEFYWDDDVDETLRTQVEQHLGTELVDEDYGDMSDGAIIWWRRDDGTVDDLTDLLTDASANFDQGGLIWVLTPKTGGPGAVESQFVEEAARTAGLRATSAAQLCPDWQGIRLQARPTGR